MSLKVETLESSSSFSAATEERNHYRLSLEEESALVRRAQTGDNEAVSALYEHFRPGIYAFCLKFLFNHSSDAEDVTSNTFVKMIRGLPEYQFRGYPFKSWLYKIAYHEAINLTRERQSMLDVSLFENQLVDEDNGVHNSVQNKLLGEQIFNNMAQLPANQSAIIHLRFVEGLSYDEIATIMRIRPASVRVIQHRAIKTLRKLLSETSFRDLSALASA